MPALTLQRMKQSSYGQNLIVAAAAAVSVGVVGDAHIVEDRLSYDVDGSGSSEVPALLTMSSVGAAHSTQTPSL